MPRYNYNNSKYARDRRADKFAAIARRKQRRIARKFHGMVLAMTKEERDTEQSRWERIQLPSMMARASKPNKLSTDRLQSKRQICLSHLSKMGTLSEQQKWLRKQKDMVKLEFGCQNKLGYTIEEICGSTVYMCKKKIPADTTVRDLPIPVIDKIYCTVRKSRNETILELELFPHMCDSENFSGSKRNMAYNAFIRDTPVGSDSESTKKAKESIQRARDLKERKQIDEQISRLFDDFSVEKFNELKQFMNEKETVKGYSNILKSLSMESDTESVRKIILTVKETVSYIKFRRNERETERPTPVKSKKKPKSKDQSKPKDYLKKLYGPLMKICGKLGFGEKHQINVKSTTIETCDEFFSHILQELDLDLQEYGKYRSEVKRILRDDSMNVFMWSHVIDHLPRSRNKVPEQYDDIQLSFSPEGIQLNLLQCRIIDYFNKQRGTHNSLLISAPTTTGKTYAYLVMACAKSITKEEGDKEYVVIIPTYSLKIQIKADIDSIVSEVYTRNIKVFTPIEFVEHYDSKQKLNNIAHIFFDEADSWMDELAPNGTQFGQAILRSISCQWTMVSATLPDLDNMVQVLTEFESHKYGQPVHIELISNNKRPVGLEWCKPAIVGHGRPEYIDWTVADALRICDSSTIPLPKLSINSTYQEGRDLIDQIKDEFCSLDDELQYNIRETIREKDLPGLKQNDIIPYDVSPSNVEKRGTNNILINAILDTYESNTGPILVPYLDSDSPIESFNFLLSYFRRKEAFIRSTEQFKKKLKENERILKEEKNKQKEMDRGAKKSKSKRSAEQKDLEREAGERSEESKAQTSRAQDLTDILPECTLRVMNGLRYVSEAIDQIKTIDTSQFPPVSPLFPGKEALIEGMKRGIVYYVSDGWFNEYGEIYLGYKKYLDCSLFLIGLGAVFVMFTDEKGPIKGNNLKAQKIILDNTYDKLVNALVEKADLDKDNLDTDTAVQLILAFIRQSSGRAGRLGLHKVGYVTALGFPLWLLLGSMEGNLAPMSVIDTIEQDNMLLRRKRLHSRYMKNNIDLQHNTSSCMIQAVIRGRIVRKAMAVEIKQMHDNIQAKEEEGLIAKEKEDRKRKLREEAEQKAKEEAERIAKAKKEKEERIEKERIRKDKAFYLENFCSWNNCVGKGIAQLRCKSCRGRGCPDNSRSKWCGKNGAPVGHYRTKCKKCSPQGECGSYSCNQGWAVLVCKSCNGVGKECTHSNCGTNGAPKGYFKIPCRSCNEVSKPRRYQNNRNRSRR